MYRSLSLSEGTPIGVIKGGKYDGKVIKIRTSDKAITDAINDYYVGDDDDGLVQPIYSRPMPDKSTRLNICGATLCGKSYYAGGIAKDYKKKNKNNKVVLFSAVDEDEHLDDIPNLYRIKCDESILKDPIDPKELHDSLCIFDDIDSFGNKDIVEELNSLRDKLMKSGRHENIDVISTNQLMLNGKQSQNSLLNSFQIVGFPQSGGRYQLKEFLKRYMAMDKEDIDKIINLPSRWVTIQRVPPLFCLHQKGAFLL